MSNNLVKKDKNCQALYELRTLDTRGDIADILNFIQEEFLVCRQTAKKMIRPGISLVYHLDKTEAEEHLRRYETEGLLCEIVQMGEEELRRLMNET